MGVVVEGLGHRVGRCRSVGVAVGVCGGDGYGGSLMSWHIIEQVVHDEVAVLLADKRVGHGFGVAVMVACGEGILSFAAEPFHGGGDAVFGGCDPPPRVGVEDVGHDDATAAWQVPVGSIALAVEVGVCVEESHLQVAFPSGRLVEAVGDGRPAEGVNVVAVWRSADVDV